MSREEQKRLNDIAREAMNRDRSREEILDTLQDAGIVDEDGEIMSPYDQVFE